MPGALEEHEVTSQQHNPRDPHPHQARIVSGYATGYTGHVRVYNWTCKCGAVGPGKFPSAMAAQNDHDDHTLAMIQAE